MAACWPQGLQDRWCDRYENRGKQSGAFSAGSYDGNPYILMNYQPDVLDHVSPWPTRRATRCTATSPARISPSPTTSYSLFVAEVASTFNEQLAEPTIS